MQESKLNSQQQRTQLQLVRQYWNQWIDYTYEVKRQRHQALRMLQFQNQLQEHKLRYFFNLWQQVNTQQKINQLNQLKESFVNQEQANSFQQDDNDQFHKIGLAINYYQKNIYSKALRAWIQYSICCKKFQNKISTFYIRYLLKKYFHIVNEYRTRSQLKKTKKAQTLLDISTKHQQQQIQYSKPSQTQNNKTQFDFQNISQNLNKGERNFSFTNPNFKEIISKNSVFPKKQSEQNVQSNTSYNFQRNPVFGQSRRSQISTISANLDYQSKRKFRPITQLPSIPDIENIPKKVAEIQKQQRKEYQTKSPVKLYESRAQSQTTPYNPLDGTNLARSNVTVIREQDPVKSKILDFLLKEKLITLAIMDDQQFSEGLEYENYRQKTLNSLRKIKELKIN